MKKLFLLLFSLFLLGFSGGTVLAEDAPPPLTSKDVLFNEDLLRGTKLHNYAEFTDEEVETMVNDWQFDESLPEEYKNRETPGEFFFKNTILKVTDFIRKIMIPLAVLFSAWGGFQLIASRNDEQLLEEKKRHIYSMATGFVVIFLATVTVDNVFFGEYGQALDSREITTEFATRGISEIQGLFRYATTFVVAIAVGFIIFSAIKMMVTAGEREEEVANLKKRLVYTITGMVLLVSAQNFVRIFLREGKLSVPDIPDTIELVIRWGNFVLGLIGVLAVFGMVYSGIRLVSNMGVDDEGTEDAKNILKACGIGLVLAFSAWTFMYYFLVPLG